MLAGPFHAVTQSQDSLAHPAVFANLIDMSLYTSFLTLRHVRSEQWPRSNQGSAELSDAPEKSDLSVKTPRTDRRGTVE